MFSVNSKGIQRLLSADDKSTVFSSYWCLCTDVYVRSDHIYYRCLRICFLWSKREFFCFGACLYSI